MLAVLGGFLLIVLVGTFACALIEAGGILAVLGGVIIVAVIVAVILRPLVK